jgi:hypothetical protein
MTANIEQVTIRNLANWSFDEFNFTLLSTEETAESDCSFHAQVRLSVAPSILYIDLEAYEGKDAGFQATCHTTQGLLSRLVWWWLRLVRRGRQRENRVVIWKGKGTCWANVGASTTVTISLYGDLCHDFLSTTGTPPVVMTQVKVTDMTIDLVDLDCELQGTNGISILTDILKVFKPILSKDIGRKLEPKVKRAANNALQMQILRASRGAKCSNKDGEPVKQWRHYHDEL